MTDPLFIIGTERSGSNLLRVILDTHSRIAIPHPPHIVRYFAPLEPSYGDLSGSDADFSRFVDDVIKLVNRHVYPWDFEIDRARVLREAEPRDAFGVTVALYDEYLERTGKARWGCKSTFMIDYTDRILARFPGARLIYLTRDPRDAAASSRASVFNPFHPYFTAVLWARQQRVGLSLLDRLPPQTILHVRYEDLLSDPVGVVSRVCGFLGEDFEEPMLRYFETAEARKGASLCQSWRNTGRPIQSDNHGKYRCELTEPEIAAVEGAARAEMERLGYSLTSPSPSAPPTWQSLLRCSVLDFWWRLQVECRSLRSDRNHWLRWRRDLTVACLRLAALFRSARLPLPPRRKGAQC
jgi:hypothetical protein